MARAIIKIVGDQLTEDNIREARSALVRSIGGHGLLITKKSWNKPRIEEFPIADEEVPGFVLSWSVESEK